jgi:hypothetical protein
MSNDDISKSRPRFLQGGLVTLPPLAAKSVYDPRANDANARK